MESVTFNCPIVDSTNAINSETIRARAMKFTHKVYSINGKQPAKCQVPTSNGLG